MKVYDIDDNEENEENEDEINLEIDPNEMATKIIINNMDKIDNNNLNNQNNIRTNFQMMTYNQPPNYQINQNMNYPYNMNNNFQNNMRNKTFDINQNFYPYNNYNNNGNSNYMGNQNNYGFYNNQQVTNQINNFPCQYPQNNFNNNQIINNSNQNHYFLKKGKGILNNDEITEFIIEICKKAIEKCIKSKNKNEIQNQEKYIIKYLKKLIRGEWFVLICHSSLNNFDFKFSHINEDNIMVFRYKNYDIYICLLYISIKMSMNCNDEIYDLNDNSKINKNIGKEIKKEENINNIKEKNDKYLDKAVKKIDNIVLNNKADIKNNRKEINNNQNKNKRIYDEKIIYDNIKRNIEIDLDINDNLGKTIVITNKNFNIKNYYENYNNNNINIKEKNNNKKKDVFKDRGKKLEERNIEDKKNYNNKINNNLEKNSNKNLIEEQPKNKIFPAEKRINNNDKNENKKNYNFKNIRNYYKNQDKNKIDNLNNKKIEEKTNNKFEKEKENKKDNKRDNIIVINRRNKKEENKKENEENKNNNINKNKPDDIIEFEKLDFFKDNIPVNNPNIEKNKRLYNELQRKIKRILSIRRLPQFNFNNYKIQKSIGQGTYGQLYVVINNNSKKKYAMKEQIAGDIYSFEEYAKSFEINYKNKHENILDIYGIYTIISDEKLFFIYALMDLAECDWEQEVEKRKSSQKYYTEIELISILKQLVSALAFLQRKNIAHRDIKLENILLFSKNPSKFNSEKIYKICDFGEAKQRIKYNTKHNTVRGTDYYMSPELLFGLNNQKDYVKNNPHKSDVFSLGCCMIIASTLDYEFINNIRNEDNQEKINDIIKTSLENYYSEKLIEIFTKMLDYDAMNRIDFINLEKLVNKEFK